MDTIPRYVNTVHFILSRNVYSVNMKVPTALKQNYHHGDLRAALIRAGLALLEERDADNLGLREVARAVGVSAASVYRHFPNKESLLQALAAEGLSRLGEAQRAASDIAGGGSAGFAATGKAYVAFALANPALFRLIFSSPVLESAGVLSEKEDGASLLLIENAALVAGSANAEEARKFATQSWALVHGLAVLILDKRLPNDPNLVANVIDKAVSQMRSGGS